MTETTTDTDEHGGHHRSFTFEVNDRDITSTEHHQTGDEIKAAAIAAGVPIQQDFVLSRVLPHGKQKVVPNDKKVEVDEDDEFWAIPGDDNS